jgi:hypothetical protein
MAEQPIQRPPTNVKRYEWSPARSTAAHHPAASFFLFFLRLIGSPPRQTLIALGDFKHRAMGDGVKDLCGEPAGVLGALDPVLGVVKEPLVTSGIGGPA